MAKNFPNLMKHRNIHNKEAQKTTSSLKEIHTETHHNQIVKSQRQNIESSKTEVMTYGQVIFQWD